MIEFEYISVRKPRKCPKCDSRRVARILYGLPTEDEQLFADVEAGKFVLGGCCQLLSAPSWQCVDCETQVHSQRVVESYQQQK